MLHYLTICFLDPVAARTRRISVIRPLSPEVLRLLESFLDEGTGKTLGGAPVEIQSGFVRCGWHTPRRNRRAEQFAVAASNLGCTIADVEHARIVEVAQLQMP
jgi:hypothetical protein